MYDIRIIYTAFGWSLIGLGAAAGALLGNFAGGLTVAFAILTAISLQEGK